MTENTETNRAAPPVSDCADLFYDCFEGRAWLARSYYNSGLVNSVLKNARQNNLTTEETAWYLCEKVLERANDLEKQIACNAKSIQPLFVFQENVKAES